MPKLAVARSTPKLAQNWSLDGKLVGAMRKGGLSLLLLLIRMATNRRTASARVAPYSMVVHIGNKIIAQYTDQKKRPGVHRSMQ